MHYKRNPCLFHDMDFCFSFLQDWCQFKKSSNADIHFIGIVFFFYIPKQYVSIATQVHKTFRGSSLKADSHISFYILHKSDKHNRPPVTQPLFYSVFPNAGYITRARLKIVFVQDVHSTLWGIHHCNRDIVCHFLIHYNNL